MLRLLIDENLPHSFARSLRLHGHQADHVCQVGLEGKNDEAVLSFAIGTDSCIVTRDRGLGNSLMLRKGVNIGILVLRFNSKIPKDRLLSVLVEALASHAPERIRGHLLILGRGRARIRAFGIPLDP